VEGEKMKGSGGEGRGEGRENRKFVLCPGRKKRKIGAYDPNRSDSATRVEPVAG